MKRFQSILVYPLALDTTDPAIATAASMALHSGAALTVASIPPPDDGDGLERRRRLERLVRGMQVVGIDATAVVLPGADPAASVLVAVRKSAIDLVVKTARPGDVPGSRVFSSVATRLMAEAPCPVWVVRSERTGETPRVLAAVAQQHGNRDDFRLDRDVLEVGAQLAHARGGELHVVSAWQALGAGLLRTRLPADDYRHHVRMCRRESRRALRAFLARHAPEVRTRHVHFRPGLPARVIAQTADAIDAEIVVVGSAGRSGLRRWIVGNTAEEVLRSTERGVVGVTLAGAA